MNKGKQEKNKWKRNVYTKITEKVYFLEMKWTTNVKERVEEWEEEKNLKGINMYKTNKSLIFDDISKPSIQFIE